MARCGDGLRQRRAQACRRPRKARLHGPGRTTEHGGDVGYGQLFEVAQGEHQPVVDVEPIERGEHALALAAPDRGVGGVGGRRLGRGGETEFRSPSTPPTPAVIASGIGDHGEEPRLERTIGVEAGDRLPRSQRGDLDDVVGVAAAPTHHGSDAQRRLACRGDEPVVGGVVATDGRPAVVLIGTESNVLTAGLDAVILANAQETSASR